MQNKTRCCRWFTLEEEQLKYVSFLFFLVGMRAGMGLSPSLSGISKERASRLGGDSKLCDYVTPSTMQFYFKILPSMVPIIICRTTRTFTLLSASHSYVMLFILHAFDALYILLYHLFSQSYCISTTLGHVILLNVVQSIYSSIITSGCYTDMYIFI